MKKMCCVLLTTSCFLTSSINGQSLPFNNPQAVKTLREKEEGIVNFTPPAGWMLADQNSLPGRVRTMVVGKGLSNFPPSLNISSEPYKGTLKQYLKTVKNINTAQGYEWKDLGTIQTQAGLASLSQVDTKTQWGTIRLMHVILVKNDNVYILTGSALKDEFPTFYKDFFNAMKSLKVNKDIYETVTNIQERNQLKTTVERFKREFEQLIEMKEKENPGMNPQEVREAVFKSDDFQNTMWNPFKEATKQKYAHLGPEWQSLFLQKIENELKN
ncbi:MAG: hypothetical protein ACH350_03255 [Parachlamydiaceae bacterium]